jgi:uncharacterized FAD-dependent dehydrogenase
MEDKVFCSSFAGFSTNYSTRFVISKIVFWSTTEHMQKQVQCRVLPAIWGNDASLRATLAGEAGVDAASVTGYRILRKSIDARSRQPMVQLTALVWINEPFFQQRYEPIEFEQLPAAAPRVIIIGAGPCGLFAALKLAGHGIRPIIIERGKDVRARRRDLARLNREGIIDPDSNYCFGEGGAGTYSDGKLYTRSNKRGDINRILQLLHQFGAAENILYEAHPHIGTNKLPGIISAMREQLLDCGAEIYFGERVTDLIIENNRIVSVKTQSSASIEGEAVLLAAGHSARDIFTLLHRKEIFIEAKPFALGVRIEHPQSLIDSIQYHCTRRDPFLPPASYGLVEQVANKGVFSFCMCPGGIIATASTAPGELVVNGWSPSKRDNPFANSGMVVEVGEKDLREFFKGGKEADGPLSGMYFQQAIEQKAYAAGGGQFVAPAQRMNDFVEGRVSGSLPLCSYVPGVLSTDLCTVLPAFIHERLREGFKVFGRKMRGYLSNEAIVVATESRTSSPVRVPRDPGTLQHPQVANLYPAGEGAGYAGGIVSAAMDGERVADAIAAVLQRVS